MLATLTVVGVIVLAALTLLFLRTRQQDLIADMLARKKASSRVATRADLVEGMERIPVALTLDATAIYYENPDLQASFEIAMIDEVEYDDELATGKNVDPGCRVMRLRCHGRAIEFIVSTADEALWKAALNPHLTGQAAQAV